MAIDKTVNLAPTTEETTTYKTSGSVSTRAFKILRQQVDDNKNTLQAQITVNADEIALKASKTYVDNSDLNLQSQITVNAGNINLKVSKNDVINQINVSTEGVQISASKLAISGYVQFTNLSTAGQTTINGGNITTGTLNASLCNVTNINASNISTGTLSADKIYGGTINGNTVNVINLNADNINAGSLSVNRLTAGTVSGWYFGTDTISRGQITLGNDYIRLEGYDTSDATINFYNTRYGTTTRIYAYDQSGAMGFDATVVRYTGGITVDGNIYTYGTTSVRSVYPTTTNSYNLGSSTLRWATIWQTSGSVVGSDRRLKDNIKVIDKGVDLILNLKPVEYTYKGGTRTHYGLIAQEVKDTLDTVGINDAALYIDPIVKPDWDITNPEENDQDHYLALRYDELIAPMIQTIQQLNERITSLESTRTL